jgi:hypothetical protein
MPAFKSCYGKSRMSSLVSTAFREWTDGLDMHQGMISIFEHIRDIPYSLAAPIHDPQSAPEQILRLGKGSCGPKHYLLADMYRRLGLKVVFATFAFSWNDPDLLYPPSLRKLAAHIPISHHLACRVEMGHRWVLVDATWDRPLKQAGFPVNEYWDGYADTRCAVKPLRSPVRTAFCRTGTNEPCRGNEEKALNPLDGEKNYWDEEDRARYDRGRILMRTAEDMDRIGRFYREFEEWLERVRSANR